MLGRPASSKLAARFLVTELTRVRGPAIPATRSRTPTTANRTTPASRSRSGAWRRRRRPRATTQGDADESRQDREYRDDERVSALVETERPRDPEPPRCRPESSPGRWRTSSGRARDCRGRRRPALRRYSHRISRPRRDRVRPSERTPRRNIAGRPTSRPAVRRTVATIVGRIIATTAVVGPRTVARVAVLAIA